MTREHQISGGEGLSPQPVVSKNRDARARGSDRAAAVMGGFTDTSTVSALDPIADAAVVMSEARPERARHQVGDTPNAPGGNGLRFPFAPPQGTATSFPLVLAAALIMFLALQGRLDGDNPKLASGSSHGDPLSFE